MYVSILKGISMRIFGEKDNVYAAVDAVIEYGLAAIDGTKTFATNYSQRIINCLEPYDDISPVVGYEEVPNNGYLYYVFDTNKFHIGDVALKTLLLQIDADNNS